LRRSQASQSRTTARRAWRDSDSAQQGRDNPVQSSGLARGKLVATDARQVLPQKVDLWSSKRHPECGRGSRAQFDRGQAMLGHQRAGHRHISSTEKCILVSSLRADQLVEADARCDVTTRSHRRIECFSYARCE
jgi:hypothetical protein